MATILTYPASLIIAWTAIMVTMRAVMRKLKLTDIYRLINFCTKSYMVSTC